MPTQETYAILGFEGKITIDGVDLDDVRNVSCSYKYADVDATIRRHKGVKAYAKGLLDCTISFTLVMMTPPSPGAAIVQEALHSRRKVVKLTLSAEDGGGGPSGDFHLFGGDVKMDDEGLYEIDIEAKPAVAGQGVEWVG